MRSIARRPIQDLFSIHSDMNRLFDQWARPARYRAEGEGLDWMPVADILEADGHVENPRRNARAFRAGCPSLRDRRCSHAQR